MKHINVIKKHISVISLATLFLGAVPGLAGIPQDWPTTFVAFHKLPAHRSVLTAHKSLGLKAAIMLSSQDDIKPVLEAIEHGANVNQKDSDRTTPLMWASMGNLPLITRLLLRKGANVAALNNDGLNALDYAEHPVEVSILLKAGAMGSKQELVVSQDILETGGTLNVKYLDGYINNASKALFHFVRVQAVFYNAQGAPVASGSALSAPLAAGKKWKFKIVPASITSESIVPASTEVVTYKIISVSGG
ncbi:MAG: FxLYD domain-containing protein [Janthinobacterium lividum]